MSIFLVIPQPSVFVGPLLQDEGQARYLNSYSSMQQVKYYAWTFVYRKYGK